eukprot:2669361-Heterocapsa_arctica.AAC.1
MSEGRTGPQDATTTEHWADVDDFSRWWIGTSQGRAAMLEEISVFGEFHPFLAATSTTPDADFWRWALEASPCQT